ncbi:MAG: glycosyltransferase family 2 protein, partial [Anaerolineae bacterium]
IFEKPLESHFGWLGIGSVIGGTLLYSLNVWRRWNNPRRQQTAPWFVPASSAIMVLTGIQLFTSWLLTLVLSELKDRDARTEADLNGR